MNKLAVIPKLDGLDDTRAVESLSALHALGCGGIKAIFDTGLYAYHLKARLPHGQFGNWLRAHGSEKLWTVNKKNRPKASPTLSWQMHFCRLLLESKGLMIEDTLSKFLSTWEFPLGGKFLLLGPSLVPALARPLHGDLSSRVEGKTAYQLFLELKQGEIGEDGDLETKRGRLPGQGGRPTDDEIDAKDRALRWTGQAWDRLDKAGVLFTALTDDQNENQLAKCERLTKCLKAWLNTPKGQRDATALAAIEKLWNGK